MAVRGKSCGFRTNRHLLYVAVFSFKKCLFREIFITTLTREQMIILMVSSGLKCDLASVFCVFKLISLRF